MSVWNAENFIEQAIDSLLSQDFTDFELIISDNASTDKTGEICRQYAKRDNRIRYYRNDVNIGMEANFKKVLDLANAPYFMWASYDDLWEPSYISEMVEVLDNNESLIIASSISDEIDEEGKQTWAHYDHLDLYSQGTTFKRAYKFLIKDHWYHQANFIYGLMRASVIEEIGGFVNFREYREERHNMVEYAIDTLTIFRLIFEGDFFIVDKVLFHHRIPTIKDDYSRFDNKLDLALYFCSKVLNMFPNVHGYFVGTRKIIFESNLRYYQKSLLFFASWFQEFKTYVGFLIYYIITFLKLVGKVIKSRIH